MNFPRQYIDAAIVCGISPLRSYFSIELPLITRHVIPPLLNAQVNILHMTLFGSLISVNEIFRVAQRINSNVYHPIEIYTALGLFVLMISLPINGVAFLLKQRYGRDLSEKQQMLSGTDLNKSFGDTVVLDSVTIDISPGEIAVLTGPSGSGKSTLIRILALLDPLDSGTVILDNQRFTFPMTNDSSRNSIYPTVISVFQQLYLWPHLTNRENILLALRYDKRVDKDVLDLYIELFEMHAFIDKFPNQSSLGQRQRVALTRAFVLKSKYLLLDEVTSALDSKNTELILSELEGKCAEGKGVLIITHDIQIAAKRNLKVFILENRQIHLYK